MSAYWYPPIGYRIGPPLMSSSEHDWRMLYGPSLASTPGPITPPVLVTCIVIPRRKPPGVTLLTTSCEDAPNCMLNVENGASRYRLLPTVNGISPLCGCAEAGGADTPPGTGMWFYLLELGECGPCNSCNVAVTACHSV